MPRIARKDLQTPFLHIMVQGINKKFIFSKKEYIENYLKIMNKYKQEFNITIIAYCIMNNHAHMLVYVENIELLGKFMHIVNLVYSQFYNKENKRCGVLFRNKYQAEPIYGMNHLINCIKYIHMNPLKAKIVKNVEDYPYSSVFDYTNNTGICKNKIMSNIFGDNYDYSKLTISSSNCYFIDIVPPSKSDLRDLIDSRFTKFSKNK